MSERFHRTCNLCEAMCGLLVTVGGGRVTDVRGDPDDVLSRGHICPKAPALRDLQEDPDRLQKPMRRTERGFEPVGWDEAFAEATERLAAIQRRDGHDAVGIYIGNPTVHNHGAALMSQLLTLALGSKNRFDANSQDANPKLYACLSMYGDSLSLTVPDVDRTSFLLMLGANPAASNGSVMTLGDVKGRLRGIAERGGRFVLVDPRRTETAAWATEHVPIRPGGDAAFVAAMIATIFEQGLVDEPRVGAVARGLATLRDATRPFTPERVAGAVGIDAAKIRELAVSFAKAPTAVAYARIGICHSEHSATASWLVEALNVVTGNFDRPGGAMFPSPAVDLSGLAAQLGIGGAGRVRSRVRGLPDVGGQLPAAAMAEEMETPGPGQIRGFVTVAGNPVLSVPGSERLARALAGLEYYVAVDIYINETTRHANLVLPPCSPLERSHYDLVFHALAVRNTVKYSLPVLTPPADTRDDWDILSGLASGLVARRAGLPSLSGAASVLRRVAGLDADKVVDLLLRSGPYGDKFLPWRDGLSLAKVAAAPSGIDLGPMVPSADKRVRTDDRHVRLAPADLVADLARVATWLEGPQRGALALIGRRHVRSNNSWMHNLPSLTKGPDRSALLMHPSDAARRGLAAGDRARVSTAAGSVTARVEITSDVMPGVVSLPHGFGHGPARDTLRVAGPLAGANANALTDERHVEPLTGTAILTGVSVDVERLEAVSTVDQQGAAK